MTAPEATRNVEPTAAPAPAEAEPATGRGTALGTVAVYLLLAEAATGLGLVFFYRPAAATAYLDLVDLEQASGFGFLRALHHWGAHAIVVLVWLQIAYVLLRGARLPCRRDWHRTLALLVVVMALAATGHVLRWDAATAGWLAALGLSPQTGVKLRLVYGLHCAVLPLLIVWLLRAGRRRARSAYPPDARPRSGPAPLAATAIGLLIVLCALVYETPLGPPPGSVPAPDHAAPWFLSGLEELGRYVDPWVSTLALPLLLLGALAALPALETAHARADRDPAVVRRYVRRPALFVLLLWIVPIAVAAVLRGPFASGVAAHPPPAAFSDVFWGLWLGTGVPASGWLRELPGIVLLALYVLVPSRWLPRWRATRGVFATYRRDLGRWRYYAATFWILALGVVPLKMVGYWLWGIGVWIDLPELGLRF